MLCYGQLREPSTGEMQELSQEVLRQLENQLRANFGYWKEETSCLLGRREHVKGGEGHRYRRRTQSRACARGFRDMPISSEA